MIISIDNLMLQRRRQTMHNTSNISRSADTNEASSSGASTPRSSSIPLPSTHVPRTESELQLSHDQAAAEQRDLHMFYRLVNGIRNRQAQEPSATSIPYHPLPLPRVIDESPPKGSNALAWQVGNNEPSPLLHQQRSGSWSISGFDCSGSNDPLSPSANAGPSIQPEDEDDALLDEDEGVFDMDL